MSTRAHSPAERKLLAENEALRMRLAEAEDTLRAIRNGEVDALRAESSVGPRIFTLHGLDTESNRFRGEILAHVNEAIIAFDDDRRITYMNASAERQYHVSAANMLGRPIGDVYQDRWQQPGDEIAMHAALREHGAWHGENIHVLRDGRQLPVECNLSVFHDGDLSGVLAVIRDITARKATGEAVAELNLRLERRVRELQAILESSPIGIMMAEDPQCRNIWINPAMRTLLHIPQETVALNGIAAATGAQLPYHVRRDGEDISIHELPMRRCIATGQAVLDDEMIAILPDGTMHNWSKNSVPLFDEAGRVRGSISFVVDLTARKHAEEDLRASAARLRAIYDGTHEYMWLLARNGTLLEANQASLKFAGSQVEDVVGRPFWDTVWFRYTTGAPEAIRQAVTHAAAGETVRFESMVITPFAATKWFDISVHAIRGDKGEVVQIVAVGLDITERKRAELALMTLNETLERRVDERTATLAHVNDELMERTGLLRKLAIELTHTEVRERRRLAQILHDHVQQLLYSARIHADVIGSQTKDDAVGMHAAKVTHLIDQIEKACRSLIVELAPPLLEDAGLVEALRWLGEWMAEHHQLSVHVSSSVDIKPDSDGISLLFFQCTREALFNVIKHSGASVAAVSVEKTDSNAVRVIITDKGHGFDVAKSPQAGFGLFSMRERLNLVGGTMNIDSASGTGTRVTLEADIPAPDTFITPTGLRRA